MRARGLLAILAVPVPLTLLLVALADTQIPFACAPASAITGGPPPANAAGCIEFWLNRYQAGIAAILALYAARVAWNKISEQIREARRQNRLAYLQVAAGNIDPLKHRVDGLEEIIRKINLSRTAAWEGAQASLEVARILRLPLDEERAAERRVVREQTKRLEQSIEKIGRHVGDMRAITPNFVLKKNDRMSITIASEALDADLMALSQNITLIILCDDPGDEDHYRSVNIIESVEGYASTILHNEAHGKARGELESSAKSLSSLLESLIEATETYVATERAG